MIVATPMRIEQWAARSLKPVWTGMGKTAFFDDDIVVMGVAGALVPELKVGDVVFMGREVVANRLRAAGLIVHEGAIAHSDHIVDAPEERAALAAQGALAVDMESALITGSGSKDVVRVIVDTPEERFWALGILTRGVRALATLRRAARALHEFHKEEVM